MMHTGFTPATASLAETIRQAILAAPEQRITFAEFMHLALYAPGQGYYRVAQAPERTGHFGDYDTAPEMHPVFGACIARQLAQMWLKLGKPAEFSVIEAGAGSGALARAIIRSAPMLDRGFSEALQYYIVEPFAPLQQAQQRLLGTAARWVSALAELEPVAGCILANELLDAFPVHRLQHDSGTICEVYTGLSLDEQPDQSEASAGYLLPPQFNEWLPERSDEGTIEGSPLQLCEVLAPPSLPALAGYGACLDEGERVAVNLEAMRWQAQAAAKIEPGYLLVVDYGYRNRQEHRAKARDVASDGVRCYYRHTVQADPYIRIGKQDVTAPVDFGALQRNGESLGLRSECLLTQREWLRGLGIEQVLAQLEQEPRDIGYYQERMAIEELIRPGGMGDFLVLIQSRLDPKHPKTLTIPNIPEY